MVNEFEAQHLGKQIIRSGTASSLLYGEAQGAISKKDFIHKISLVLRELRETQMNLRIIDDCKLMKDRDKLIPIKDENNQLIAIFIKTLQTARMRG